MFASVNEFKAGANIETDKADLVLADFFYFFYPKIQYSNLPNSLVSGMWVKTCAVEI